MLFSFGLQLYRAPISLHLTPLKTQTYIVYKCFKTRGGDLYEFNRFIMYIFKIFTEVIVQALSQHLKFLDFFVLKLIAFFRRQEGNISKNT